MAKQKRTRLQKIAAEQRLSKPSSQPPQSSPSLQSLNSPFTHELKTHHTSHASRTSHQDYHYVRRDLLKTISITGAIVLAELVLFFVMKA